MEPGQPNEMVPCRQDTCYLWNISWWLFLKYQIKLVSHHSQQSKTKIYSIHEYPTNAASLSLAILLQYCRNNYVYVLSGFLYFLLRLPITITFLICSARIFYPPFSLFSFVLSFLRPFQVLTLLYYSVYEHIIVIFICCYQSPLRKCVLTPPSSSFKCPNRTEQNRTEHKLLQLEALFVWLWL